MATSTDGVRAHDILLSYEPLSRHGACWYYVWQAYAAAGASTGMGSSATAYEGWQLSQGKHYDMNPPNGAAIWLGRRYDGNMSGDVFIAGASDGQHAATDQPVYGQTGLVSIRDRMNLCGREYLGWTDHVLDCPILSAQPEPEPEPPKRRKRRNMVHAAWRDDNGSIMVQHYPRGRCTEVPDPIYWAGVAAATGAEAAKVTNAEYQNIKALYGTVPYAATDMEHSTSMVMLRDMGDGTLYLLAGGALVELVDDATYDQIMGRVPELNLPGAEIANLRQQLGGGVQLR